MMKDVAVDSEAILRIAYDGPRQHLYLTFRDGDRYRYYDVPERTYDALMQAESKGGFFSAHIRNSYDYELVG